MGRGIVCHPALDAGSRDMRVNVIARLRVVARNDVSIFCFGVFRVLGWVMFFVAACAGVFTCAHGVMVSTLIRVERKNLLLHCVNVDV